MPATQSRAIYRVATLATAVALAGCSSQRCPSLGYCCEDQHAGDTCNSVPVYYDTGGKGTCQERPEGVPLLDPDAGYQITMGPDGGSLVLVCAT